MSQVGNGIGSGGWSSDLPAGPTASPLARALVRATPSPSVAESKVQMGGLGLQLMVLLLFVVVGWRIEEKKVVGVGGYVVVYTVSRIALASP